MYPDTTDLLSGVPQYARTFGPDQSFSVQPGTACATQSSTGGYVHVVRRRTNGWDGAFAGGDLEPAIVTANISVTRTRWYTMMRQAVMEPETVALSVRGPRRTTACAARSPQSWRTSSSRLLTRDS